MPACIDGTLADLSQGSEVVFEDFSDDKKSLRSCRGLRNFVRTTWQGVPMTIVDNHNHALYFWYEARSRGYFSTPLALVHIDEHSDKRSSHVRLPVNATPQEAFVYTNRDVNVGNFIQPLLENGFFSSYEWVADEAGCQRVLRGLEESSFETRKEKNLSPEVTTKGFSYVTTPFVLDFDVDFFSPQLDYMDWDLRVRTVRALARRASYITIATSPFFIDQERAIRVIREIFTEESTVL